jgi:hypothetical protein
MFIGNYENRKLLMKKMITADADFGKVRNKIIS